LAGIEEFNSGAFFECHETLEALWMAESRPLRTLYKGILQIGVAFYHLRAERYRGAVVLLQRGMGHLKPFAPHCLGVDVAALLERAAGCLTEVRRLGPERLREFDWSLIPVIDMQSSV
jgi:hypothetical protein